MSAADAACFAYLLLPIALFLAFFAAPAIAVAGLTCLAVSVARLRIARPKSSLFCTRNGLIALAAAALALLVGIFPPLNLPHDWTKHYAIFNLLIDQPWPVVVNNGHEMLRYYFGLYLPPAALTKLFGRWSAEIWIFAWLWLSLFLCLRTIVSGATGWRAGLVAVIFVGMGGADVVGNLVLGPHPAMGTHLEWWARFVSFTSQSTLLAWVPQHALAGWLIVSLLIRRGAWTVQLAGPLLVAACLWSPFVALGLAPFFALRAFESGSRGTPLTFENLVVAPVVGIPIAAFLTTGTAHIIAGPIWTSPGFSWTVLLLFYVIEFLALAIVLVVLGTRRPLWLWVAIASLLAFPLYRLGMANDFAMRTTIPALAVLALVTAETILAGSLLRASLLGMFVLIAVVGPISDFRGRWGPSYHPAFRSMRLNQVLNSHPSEFKHQYLAPYPHWTLR